MHINIKFSYEVNRSQINNEVSYLTKGNVTVIATRNKLHFVSSEFSEEGALYKEAPYNIDTLLGHKGDVDGMIAEVNILGERCTLEGDEGCIKLTNLESKTVVIASNYVQLLSNYALLHYRTMPTQQYLTFSDTYLVEGDSVTQLVLAANKLERRIYLVPEPDNAEQMLRKALVSLKVSAKDGDYTTEYLNVDALYEGKIIVTMTLSK